MNFKSIIKRHTVGISIVVFFLIVENMAWILEPTYFGKLLDALIDKFYKHDHKKSYVLPLAFWIGIYLLNTLGGTLSRLFSGKIYAKLYVDIAGEVISSSAGQGYSTSRTIARAELAKEYITFLKDRLPEVIWQISATFGAIFALFFYDWRIAGICFTVIFPIAFIYNGFRKNMIEIQKNLHDNREDLYTLFDKQNSAAINEYYEDMVVPQSHISKWNALNYSVTKLLMMIIFVVVLFICVDVDKFSTGKIYAIVSYLWTFILSTEYLPGLMESVTSLLELNDRLKQEETG
jgi:ABC-type multidrug transport system fused ATPase/permease subunit